MIIDYTVNPIEVRATLKDLVQDKEFIEAKNYFQYNVTYNMYNNIRDKSFIELKKAISKGLKNGY